MLLPLVNTLLPYATGLPPAPVGAAPQPDRTGSDLGGGNQGLVQGTRYATGHGPQLDNDYPLPPISQTARLQHTFQRMWNGGLSDYFPRGVDAPLIDYSNPAHGNRAGEAWPAGTSQPNGVTATSKNMPTRQEPATYGNETGLPYPRTIFPGQQMLKQAESLNPIFEAQNALNLGHETAHTFQNPALMQDLDRAEGGAQAFALHYVAPLLQHIFGYVPSSSAYPQQTYDVWNQMGPDWVRRGQFR